MIITPSEILKLWTIYQEDGVTISGLTDLSVEVLSFDNSSLLTTTSLIEEGSTGLYYYNWDTSSVSLGDFAKVIYKKDSAILYSQEYKFDDLDDSDSIAM